MEARTFDYHEFLAPIENLDFMGEDDAESAVQSVLALFLTKLDEERGRELCEALPEPLTYEHLCSLQPDVPPNSPEEAMSVVADEADIDDEEARVVLHEVLQQVRQALSVEQQEDIDAALPPEWRAMFDFA